MDSVQTLVNPHPIMYSNPVIVSSTPENQPLTDPPTLQPGPLAQLQHRFQGRGQIVMPCIPALLEHYLNSIAQLLNALGQTLDHDGVTHLSQSLWRKLQEGFETSPHAKIVLTYEPQPHDSSQLKFQVSLLTPSLAEEYQKWVKTKEPPLFGAYPDAKAVAIAAQFDNPANAPIVDIGAGTGRNSIPLAQRGHPVDAVELAPVFIQDLQATANHQNLPLRVIPGNILDRPLKLPPAYYQLAIVSEVISHFRDVSELRLLLAKLSDAVLPGGFILFNLFLPLQDYQPDRLVVELSQSSWCTVFTRAELANAMENLPLQLLSDESAFEYERDHLPASRPPTSWYPTWSQGRNMFHLPNAFPPIELRWILCRRL
jgi:SAM-dependent methyltransferase